MKKIDYKDWQDKRALALRVRAQINGSRKGSKRPRDPLERKILMDMDRSRLELWQKSGRLTRIGPRLYRLDTSVPV